MTTPIEVSQPLVTVITACFNHSKFVIEALESVRLQTYKNIQLIITDDASSDDSVEVINNWLKTTGTPALFLAHEENIGFCRTLNDALKHAQGKYITILSADDVFLPDKLEDQVSILERSPERIGAVYSDCLQINEDGELLPNKFISSYRDLQEPPQGDIYRVLLGRNFIPAMTTLVRRECYDTVGEYDETLCYEDFDMWLRIAEHYHFAFSPRLSAKYRILSNSMTRTVLQTPKFVNLSSDFRIYEKCLKAKRLTPEERRFVMDELEGIAQQMYKLGLKQRNGFLWKVCRYAPRPYTVGMFVFSLCLVPFSRFEKFHQRFGSH